jgi:hypothetical protein
MPLGSFRLNSFRGPISDIPSVAGYILELSAETHIESLGNSGLKVDANGNIFFAVPLDDGSRIAIVKISPSAQILWQRVFREDSADTLDEFLLLSNGNVVVSYRQSNNAKLSVFNGTDGSTVFTRVFAFGDGNFAQIAGLGKDNSDNIYFAARENNQRVLHYFKYSSTGTLLNGSNRYRANPGGSGVPPIIDKPFISSQGNTLFSATRSNVSGVPLDSVIYVFTLTSTATLTFRNSYGRGDNLFPNSMTQDVNNNVYVKHDERSIIKFNSTGTVQWQKSYGTFAQIGNFNSRMITDSENLYCFSRLSSGSFNIFCISLSTGDIVWQNQLTKSNDSFQSFIHDIAVDNNLLYVSGHISTNNQRFIAVLPKDGSGLGTYGSYTLSTSTAGVVSNTAFPTMTNAFVNANQSVSIGTPNIINNAANYTLTQISQ